MRRPRNVDLNDKRTPMLRLLQDGQTDDGHVYVLYEEQWKTLWKAQKAGLLDSEQRLTPKGTMFLRAAEFIHGE